ncbi:MAG: hypothetical protein GY727_02260 [Gammaproteobacteria bacterium]|nr:hypothetical protein [Gammaproteobacteria bacterium]MCP4088851.1 hypothetical protein [Gammaproteobacteria bacterium]MCP4274867.1 hypothetical protein [Gammaproteobacteria bacterium]MCP4832066.1 hypothetical protein [Gammaproteobacteria bacterium]MCP4928333.1 hypothetical protein [Gammaproteobacteria bacterium]
MAKPNQLYGSGSSEDKYNKRVQQMLLSEELLELNEDSYPDSYLHHSNPSDVARVEHLTFICTE